MSGREKPSDLSVVRLKLGHEAQSKHAEGNSIKEVDRRQVAFVKFAFTLQSFDVVSCSSKARMKCLQSLER